MPVLDHSSPTPQAEQASLLDHLGVSAQGRLSGWYRPTMFGIARRIPFWLSIPAVLSVGAFGFYLLNTADRDDVAQLEVGGALLSGVVLSLVFLMLERRLEQAVTERQTREQYQLALAMERDLSNRDFSGLQLGLLQLPGRRLAQSRMQKTTLTGSNLATCP